MIHCGSITPFGLKTDDDEALSIYADASISGQICMGAGEPDLNLFVNTDDLFNAFHVTTGDIGK